MKEKITASKFGRGFFKAARIRKLSDLRQVSLERAKWLPCKAPGVKESAIGLSLSEIAGLICNFRLSVAVGTMT